MLNPINTMNSLTFKAVYKEKENKYTKNQELVFDDIIKKLDATPKDSFVRTIPKRMEEDYDTDINIEPAMDEESVYVSVTTKDHRTPIGKYNLDNSFVLTETLDEMFPAISEPSKINKASGLSTIALIVGAFLITLLGAVKCSNTETVAKSTEKVIEHVKNSNNNVQKIAKNTFKLFK